MIMSFFSDHCYDLRCGYHGGEIEKIEITKNAVGELIFNFVKLSLLVNLT